jgi:hypothetical protein
MTVLVTLFGLFIGISLLAGAFAWFLPEAVKGDRAEAGTPARTEGGHGP